SDHDNGRIRKITAGGMISSVTPPPILTSISLNNPGCVALDGTGNLYFADTSSGYKEIIANGQITRLSGPAAPTQRFAFGCTVDSQGNFYVSDYNNGPVRKVSSAGVTSVVAGTPGQSGFGGDGGPVTAALLNKPDGLAVDSAGNLYISDNANNR